MRAASGREKKLLRQLGRLRANAKTQPGATWMEVDESGWKLWRWLVVFKFFCFLCVFLVFGIFYRFCFFPSLFTLVFGGRGGVDGFFGGIIGTFVLGEVVFLGGFDGVVFSGVYHCFWWVWGGCWEVVADVFESSYVLSLGRSWDDGGGLVDIECFNGYLEKEDNIGVDSKRSTKLADATPTMFVHVHLGLMAIPSWVLF